jgi:hypothetical protein
MVQLALPNARLHLEIHSCTVSKLKTRQVHSGTTPTIVSLEGQSSVFFTDSIDGWVESQYCDGLRGAIVVYDPNDPHLSLYVFTLLAFGLSYLTRFEPTSYDVDNGIRLPPFQLWTLAHVSYRGHSYYGRGLVSVCRFGTSIFAY